MKHSDLCVGIDLGTTNSVIATCSLDGEKINTPVSRIERYTDMGNRNNARKESRELLPSCVYYADMKDGNYEPIVGDFAKEVSQTQPFAVARSIKRQMGQPAVTIQGWKREYPDQTPEAVSARILRHLLESLEEYYGEKIIDAVITVPASFNLAQREATLRAAEIAGLSVRDENGAYRDDILISEPEAVIYDVLNRVQNGSIHLPIDFAEKKRVLVFDIGGGTLDITLHEIIKVSDSGNHFEIRPLATNRFSTVAGDRFDEVLADWMYQQYVNEYRAQDQDIAKRIEANPQSRIPFLSYAEELKIKLSDRFKDRQKRGNPLPPDFSFDYGGYMPNGYNSENSITLEEFEEVLSVLLGTQYSYDDYKRFEAIQDDNNVIYPILDVLNKAARKLGTEEITVDAVILNGGMSRLYLIENRLAEFFRLRPITVNDPDKSVAQGAAVYHYYLHQEGSQIQELHRRFLEEQERLEQGMDLRPRKPAGERTPTILSVASVLNEAIYLGLKGGGSYLLADSGQDLPFQSPPIPCFSIAAGQTRLRIPIKQKFAKEEFRIIASGDITFRKARNKETPVAIQFLLQKNGILTLQAWTYLDREGKEVAERGSVTLNFNTADMDCAPGRRGKKVLPPAGTILVVDNELSSFRRQIENLKKERNKNRKNTIIRNLKQQKKTIISCGNPEAFATGSLKMLENYGDMYMNMNFLPVARKLSRYWTDEERKSLSLYCLSALQKELSGWMTSGPEITSNIEAIKALGFCGREEDVLRMLPLKSIPQYRSALLYAFSSAGLELEWICREFQNDVKNGYCFQDAIQAVGLGFSKSAGNVSWTIARNTASMIMEIIQSGSLEPNELVLSVIALAEVCAHSPDPEDEAVLDAKQRLQEIPGLYDENAVTYSLRARTVAQQLMEGTPLSDEDESYLLKLLSRD